MSTKKQEEQLTFEQAMEQLEQLVKQLESGVLPLEESMKLYEEGVRLTELCTKKLKDASLKIEELKEAADETGV